MHHYENQVLVFKHMLSNIIILETWLDAIEVDSISLCFAICVCEHGVRKWFLVIGGYFCYFVVVTCAACSSFNEVALHDNIQPDSLMR